METQEERQEVYDLLSEKLKTSATESIIFYGKTRRKMKKDGKTISIQAIDFYEISVPNSDDFKFLTSACLDLLSGRVPAEYKDLHDDNEITILRCSDSLIYDTIQSLHEIYSDQISSWENNAINPKDLNGYVIRLNCEPKVYIFCDHAPSANAFSKKNLLFYRCDGVLKKVDLRNKFIFQTSFDFILYDDHVILLSGKHADKFFNIENQLKAIKEATLKKLEDSGVMKDFTAFDSNKSKSTRCYLTFCEDKLTGIISQKPETLEDAKRCGLIFDDTGKILCNNKEDAKNIIDYFCLNCIYDNSIKSPIGCKNPVIKVQRP